jgi:hypothetical protein
VLSRPIFFSNSTNPRAKALEGLDIDQTLVEQQLLTLLHRRLLLNTCMVNNCNYFNTCDLLYSVVQLVWQ